MEKKDKISVAQFEKEGIEIKEKEDTKKTYIICGFLLSAIFIVCIAVLFGTISEGTMVFECNSGDIDTNITAHYHTQEYPCNISTNQVGICFEQDKLMDNIGFNGIEGMTCKGEASFKEPTWVGLFRFKSFMSMIQKIERGK